MAGEHGIGEPIGGRVPKELAQDLIHLMAHQKMIVETQHILSRCHSDDAIVVVGSDLKLRLDILAIDEELENALLSYDPDDPSKHFERLLERFDILRNTLVNVSNPIMEKWPEMRAAIVRQAALSCLLAQQRDHPGPNSFDWSDVCTKAYFRVVNRLLPQVDVDLDALDDEEQMSASKERRNLVDVFMEKRDGVSSLKLRTLLKENKLTYFEQDMKAFSRALDHAVLPKPKLLELYAHNRLLDGGMGMDLERVTGVDRSRLQGSPSKSPMGNPDARSTARKTGAGMHVEHVTDVGDARLQDTSDKSPTKTPIRRSTKRKADYPAPAAEDAPAAVEALAKANESLQRELQGGPGTVAEALAISDTISPPQSPVAKRAAIEAERGRRTSNRSAHTRGRSSGKSFTRRESRGEQVDFDDSQSVDEPVVSGPTLRDRPTPAKMAALASPARLVNSKRGKGGARARTPWTEEEVQHLNAAVSALGKGKWTLALAQYKFQDCRTPVDLKDKWRNLTKD